MGTKSQRLYLALLTVGAAVALAATAIGGAFTSDSYAQTGAPVNATPPTISGTAANGSRLTANRGTWTGTGTITYTYQWLRCTAQGEGCAAISGATEETYTVSGADVGRTLRVRVSARNANGTTNATSAATAVVQQGTEQSVPVSAVPRDERLIVSQVRFNPRVVTNRTTPITVQVRVRDTRGLLVRDARVFMRATPRVTSGDTKITGTDGWATLTLNPNSRFRVRTGYNVQFFIKAYREGDPVLGGIAAYRLVQVRTSNV